MPIVLKIGPYRFFFYSSDWQEPLHVHVLREESTAKFWLEPVRLARSKGFSSVELNKVQRLVEAHTDIIRRKWNEYFDR